MQMVGVRNQRIQNGQIVVPGNANQNPNGNGNLVVARTEGNATRHNDYTQLYDFLKYNQKEVDDLKAERLTRTQDPLELMATSNNPYTFPVALETMRIRFLGLENSESEMKNVGSKSRAAKPPAGRHTLCLLAESPAGLLFAREIILLNLSFKALVRVVLGRGSSDFTMSSLQLDLRSLKLEQFRFLLL
nr:hypothetical protein [Tanacetum cinerariifolium]